MRNLFFVFLFAAAFSQVNGQSSNQIVLGTIDSIQSNILGENRKIWVHVPKSAKNALPGKERYPVLYLLDGDAHFYSVVGMVHQLSSVNGNNICPEMIVVAIPNTDRTRDLTPTHVVSDPPYMDSTSSKTSGGGEKFISFIEKELMPHIDSLYPTQPYKMLIGHSFGGLTAMNTLVNHTKLFNSYVVIDPSMWWDNQKLLKETKIALTSRKFPETSVFLGIANTMDQGMQLPKALKDTSASTEHIRAIFQLNNYFTLNKQNQLKYAHKYYGDDTHGSVPLISEYDALHFIFKDYAFNLDFQDYTNLSMAVISKIEKHYEKITRQFGYAVKVPESMANEMGYQAVSQKHFTEAEYLFALNIKNYPDSHNAYDSLGDFYEAKNEKSKAMDSYKKALSLKETPSTRKKLEKLEAK